ncbi:MAG: DnaA/Hda family protein [Candidatus Paceibacterota bacterium]|jgi:chromosomal replication initiation ATPase DnaA
METDAKTVGGADATIGLAPVQVDHLAIVRSEFSRKMHERVRTNLGDQSYDLWIVSGGVTFSFYEDQLSERLAGVVYTASSFASGWLGDPKKVYLAAITTAFREQEIFHWKCVEDGALCEVAKKEVLPVRQCLPNLEAEKPEPVVSNKKVPKFCPGRPPVIGVSFEDFVPETSANKMALEAAQELTKSRKAARFTSAIFHGPSESGKKHLVLSTLRAMLEAYPRLDVFYLDGDGFGTLFPSFFWTGKGGQTQANDADLKIFKDRLYAAQVLVIPDLDLVGLRHDGSKRQMARAINLVRQNGGRVLISLLQPLPESEAEGIDLFGPELYRVIKEIRNFRMERISRESYPLVAQAFLAKQFISAKTPGERAIVDWIVRRTKSLTVLKNRLETLVEEHNRRATDGRRVTLPEVQELFKFPPNADDLIALVLEVGKLQRKVRRGEVEYKRVLDIACYLASEVVGLDREKVAQWFYPDTIWASCDVSGGLMRIEKLLETSEARFPLGILARELLRRFSVPEGKREFWASRLKEWTLSESGKSKGRRRCRDKF